MLVAGEHPMVFHEVIADRGDGVAEGRGIDRGDAQHLAQQDQDGVLDAGGDRAGAGKADEFADQVVHGSV